MKTIKNIRSAAVALALVSVVAGCGGGPLRCDSPGSLDFQVTLSPDSVLAGTEVTVVASFESAVFDNSEFFVQSEDVVIVDASTDEWIGTFHNSRFNEGQGDPPIVSGVVLSGEVIDDRSIELTLEFPNELVNGAIVEMGAGNDDPHCSASVYGRAPLAVGFVQ